MALGNFLGSFCFPPPPTPARFRCFVRLTLPASAFWSSIGLCSPPVGVRGAPGLQEGACGADHLGSPCPPGSVRCIWVVVGLAVILAGGSDGGGGGVEAFLPGLLSGGWSFLSLEMEAEKAVAESGYSIGGMAEEATRPGGGHRDFLDFLSPRRILSSLDRVRMELLCNQSHPLVPSSLASQQTLVRLQMHLIHSLACYHHCLKPPFTIQPRLYQPAEQGGAFDRPFHPLLARTMELPEVPSGLHLPRACSAVRCALGLTLLSLVASLAALTVTLMKGPLPPSSSSSSSSSLLGPPEKQNYAQLVLKLDNSSITKRELDWHSSETTQGVSLGSSFEYSNKTLKVTVGGLYCIYVQLNITHRLGSREAVNASLVIHRHTATGSGSVPVLTLHLDLSYNSSETVALFKAVTFRLENDDRLHVSIEASQNAHRYGSLNGRNSFFGLFQILDTVPV